MHPQKDPYQVCAEISSYLHNKGVTWMFQELKKYNPENRGQVVYLKAITVDEWYMILMHMYGNAHLTKEKQIKLETLPQFKHIHNLQQGLNDCYAYVLASNKEKKVKFWSKLNLTFQNNCIILGRYENVADKSVQYDTMVEDFLMFNLTLFMNQRMMQSTTNLYCSGSSPSTSKMTTTLSKTTAPPQYTPIEVDCLSLEKCTEYIKKG